MHPPPPPASSSGDCGGLHAAFVKCLVLLSGEGTVNVKSSVSVTTTHTGTGQSGQGGESRVSPCASVTCSYRDHSPGSPVSPAEGEVNTLRDGEMGGGLVTPQSYKPPGGGNGTEKQQA